MELFTDIPDNLASDPWFKVVDMLQHNWAVVVEQDDSVLAVFYGDTCGVFDQIEFSDMKSAELALRRNGFGKYQGYLEVQNFIALPDRKFHVRPHPGGYIYSSGKYWK